MFPLLNAFVRPFLCGVFAVAAPILAFTPAQADFPLRVESALYEDVGDAGFAVWVERDRRQPRHSVHAQVDAVIAEGIEIEFSLGRLSERDEGETARQLHAREFELKWIPIRRAHAWSWGVAIARSAEGRERATELTLLASRPIEGDYPRAVHLNLAREREQDAGSILRRTVFIAAYEHGVSNALSLLAEIEATTGRKPLRHAGLRYRFARDFYLGVMAGRDASGGVARIGLLREFD